jgi:methionine sulfoxide reductase heme-binding subunit
MSKVLPLQKWQIVQWSTIIITIVLLLILFDNGINETGFRIAIRFTARSSCILFLLAFTASSWGQIKPSPLTNWLLSNRRYLGLSMAVSHGFHAVAIAGVAVLTSENMVRDNHLGNLGYILIILMTITSFKRPAAILGRRNWRILHTGGMYYLWLSFIYSFSHRLNESWLIYFPFVAVLIMAFILRLFPAKRKNPA